MPSRRLLRVQELIKRHLGEFIRRDIPIASSGLITVNDVEVSSDLRQAKVYVAIMGDPEQQRRGLAQLWRQRARFQEQLAQAVLLKFIPHIRFVVDDSVTRGNRVLEILDDLENPSSAP